MTPLHKRLAKLRSLRGLTQSQVADAVQVDRTQISRYESGRLMLKPVVVARLRLLLQDSTPTDDADAVPSTQEVHRIFAGPKSSYDVRSEISLQTRWNQARLTLGREVVNELLEQLHSRPGVDRMLMILEGLALDSSLEYVMVARLWDEGFRFVRACPQSAGVRLLITERDRKPLYAGDVMRWSLFMHIEGLSVLLFPQVAVAVPRSRADFIGVAISEAGRLVFDLEVDGKQHERTVPEDEQRARELGLKTFRIQALHLSRAALARKLLDAIRRSIEASGAVDRSPVPPARRSPPGLENPPASGR